MCQRGGNIFDRFLVSSFISPVIFREADVGFVITDLDFNLVVCRG